jgi:hypothetical protein
MDIWRVIADEASQQSPLWHGALLPSHEHELVAVFSPLAGERFAVGLETIYEGYLVHHGRPRLFDPPEASALLLGDYLYAHGLVRIAELGEVEAVQELAELISVCSHLRAEGSPGDGEAWAASAARLDGRAVDASVVREALAAHEARVA